LNQEKSSTHPELEGYDNQQKPDISRLDSNCYQKQRKSQAGNIEFVIYHE